MFHLGFFDEKYWLPRNITWQALPTEPRDLLVPIYLTLPMLAFRIFWESLVGVPLGAALGYGKGSLFSQVRTHILGGFASNTRSKRVLECFWRLSFYSAAFCYGLYVMHDKSWLWDVRDCWLQYPRHAITDDVWWYYMLELAFYYSLLVASIWDVRRSDFWQLVFHHVITIGLLSFSFSVNFVRVGTLVLLSHDVSDVFLEFGKLVRYDVEKQTETTVCFVAFLASWIATRLGYFPLVLLRSAVYEAASLIQPDYDVFNFRQIPFAPRILVLMLCALLVLHVFWTVLILRIVAKTLKGGEVSDVRSDDEDGIDEGSEKKKKILKKKHHRKHE